MRKKQVLAGIMAAMMLMSSVPTWAQNLETEIFVQTESSVKQSKGEERDSKEKTSEEEKEFAKMGKSQERNQRKKVIPN